MAKQVIISKTRWVAPTQSGGKTVKTQTDGPMKTKDALQLIRSMPGAQFQVPRDGYAHKRAIALKLGAMHLGGHEGTLDDQQLADLDAYAALVDDLVEDGYLIAHERPISLGRAGISDEDVYAYDVVYALRDHVPFSAVSSNSSIDSAEDLLELIKEEGRLVYTTRFERGAPGFASSIARYCGEEDSQTEHLLDFVDELQENGRVTVESVSYAGSHLASKGERIDNLPSTLYIVRAV